jgi:hypothetical protein
MGGTRVIAMTIHGTIQEIGRGMTATVPVTAIADPGLARSGSARVRWRRPEVDALCFLIDIIIPDRSAR